MSRESEPEFAAFIGLDWADRKHDICLRAANSAKREASVLPHEPETIEAWALALKRRFGGGAIAVCLELTRGPIVSVLLRFDFFVIYPVNPQTLAKYREAFTPSGAKDDPTDAEFALELVSRHRDRLRALRPESPNMRALRQLVHLRRKVVGDRVRITNRLTAALKAYFPQVLDWFEDRDTGVFCAFLERWSNLPAAKRARARTLERFFFAHQVRYTSVVRRRIQAIKSATTLTEDPGVVIPAELLVKSLVARLRVVIESIRQFDREISRISAELEDYSLFAALPAAGPVFAPRLLVAFGEDRDRYASAAEVQRYSGVAPVTERSGKKCWVHWRIRAPTFLRQTFVEWAALTIPRSFWAHAYYNQQRARGAHHQAALRALAFKWIRILFRCWKDRAPYDENRYLTSLRKRGSTLLKSVAQS